MKKTLSILSLLILLLIFLNFPLKKESKEKIWKGKVEIINGEKIINNPSEPLYGEIKLDLEEVLSLGAMRDENYFFFRVSDFEVDKHGNIFILDSGNHRVQIFDSQGKYIETIGRKGQGPTDFENPYQIEIDNSGNIYVLDSSRILKIFQYDGKLIKTINLKKFYDSFSLDIRGNIIARLIENDPKTLDTLQKLIKINQRGDILKSYLESRKKRMILSGEDKLFFYFPQIDNDIIYYLSRNGYLYCGRNTKYEIFVFDENDNIIYKIRMKEKPSHLTNKEKNELANRTYIKYPLNIRNEIKNLLPDYKPFFKAILADNRNWLFVFKKYTLREDEPFSVDIFDSNGRYLYKTRLKWIPKIIENNYFYILTYGGEGDTILKQFKAINFPIKNKSHS